VKKIEKLTLAHLSNQNYGRRQARKREWTLKKAGPRGRGPGHLTLGHLGFTIARSEGGKEEGEFVEV